MNNHRTFIRTFASLNRQDRNTEWWTVDNEAKLYALRDYIPFVNLFCHDGPGGFIIYLDKPKHTATMTGAA